MSKKIYRKDKTCLNCRHVVENKFCPNCGQENTDTRKTFHHLFIHFFEDLTHYENAFWRTIKNLLFKPASLTKEYLSGKRLSYLAPVRLYIFISFVTFFVIALLPEDKEIIKKTKTEQKTIGPSYAKITFDDKSDSIKEIEIDEAQSLADDKDIQEFLKSGIISEDNKTKFQKILEDSKRQKQNKSGIIDFGYKSMAAVDSARKFGKKDGEKMSDIEYWFAKKLTKVNIENTEEEILEKAKKSAIGNIPKVLIIYMPFFAIFLWIFHGKKRWYYFDHGIFTLHYFSFLLLINLIYILLTAIIALYVDNMFFKILEVIITVATIGWMFYYFFPAHHRFYGETRLISFIKSYFLFFINMFFIIILLSAFFIYTIISIH